MDSYGALQMGGRLDAQVKRHKRHEVRIPGLGRFTFTKDAGDALLAASEVFGTNLTAVHRDGDGKVVHIHDLGSGLTTNVGSLAVANDFAWANPSGAVNTMLGLSKFHATGTGTTAAAATDLALQTAAAPTTATAVTGSQLLVSAANSQQYQTAATINYTSTLAITEWALLNAATMSSTTGTPFTATSATSFTATATPYTASSSTVAGQQLTVVKAGTTASYGLILSNTTSVGTIPAWYKVADGTAGATPGTTEAFTLIPVMWDHKVFAAINVANGDSITFTYTLTVNSGG